MQHYIGSDKSLKENLKGKKSELPNLQGSVNYDHCSESSEKGATAVS